MKNKKLIRLTESDLHRIVKESVSNILTELDWKTYMNAARKRAERDGLVDNKGRLMGAAKDLEDWGEKQFFNKHNLNAPDGTYNFDDENAERSEDIEARARSGYGHMKFNQGDWDDRNIRNSYTTFNKETGERPGGNPKNKHYNDANHFNTKVGKQAGNLYNDMHNYYSGEAQYDKQTGKWNS